MSYIAQCLSDTETMRQYRILIDLGVPYLHHPRECIRGIYDYALRNCPGWTFISDPYDFYQSFHLHDKRADGILHWSAGPSPNMEATIKAGIPGVNLTVPDEELPFPVVSGDHRKIGEAAAAHLIEVGAVSMLYVGPAHCRSRLRFEGFRGALTQHGAATPGGMFEESNHQAATFRRHLRAALRKCRPADGAGRLGVFAYSDSFANAVNQSVAALKLRVPQDVAVIGVDNDELICDLSNPPLSSIPINSRLTGFIAARTLHEMMEGQTPPPITLVPPEDIVQRMSTLCIAGDDPVIGAAINIMHKYVFDGIQVGEIVQRLPVCRRTFETRFREATGRSPHEELLRLRIEKATRLLKESRHTNSEIASACGFSSASYFEQTLRKSTGLRPSEIRGRG
jgi:LacI family transcriptional regulator